MGMRTGIRYLIGLLLVVSLPACQPTPIASCPVNELVSISAGWFIMGEDDGRRSNQPRHPVYLDEFSIQQTEVTNCQYQFYLQETQIKPTGWDHSAAQQNPTWPVTGLLWREAGAYCEWAGMRLPTEAEWEKAARGTDGRKYPWGNDWDPSRTNTLSSCIGHPVSAGSYPAGQSPYGLLDMTGNAAEWVADTFDFDYYTYAPDHNPQGPDIVMDHGMRGGSFATPDNLAAVYFRDSSHSARPNPRVGVRCAVSAVGK
jgi:formylglycine-generating enzyme required for sulfatase activity